MATRPRSSLVVVCLLVVTGLVVVIVRWQHRDRLLVLGDSMAAFGADQLRAAGSSAGYDVMVDAQVGEPLATGLDTVQHAATTGVRRLVVELGTNDVRMNASTASVDMLIDPNCIKLAHKKGINVLYADASVRWIDTQKLIASRGIGAAYQTAQLWLLIPKPTSPDTALDNVSPTYDNAMLNDAGTSGIWVWLDRP